jgi:uncharacterized protein (UPF0332 family)
LTQEQAALLEKAEKSLAAAHLLIEGGHADFAVSRAYYAMFYAAQALLLKKGLSFSKHSAVISVFGREFVKSGEVALDLHRFLIEASDSRKVSDYDIAGKIERQDAQVHINRARQFLQSIAQLLAET